MKDGGYEYTECEECGRDIPILDGRHVPRLCLDCEELRADEEREEWEKEVRNA